MNKVVLTYYYTGEQDFWHPELKEVKKPDPLDFFVLKKSVDQFTDWEFHTLSNEFIPNWNYTQIKKPDHQTLYTYKFIAIRQWLLDYPEYKWIWIVDTSDTQMLQDPPMKEDVLYTGLDCYSRKRKKYQSVRTLVNGGFRRFKYNSATHRELMKVGMKPCFNCGVLGGHRKILLEFLDILCDRLNDFNPALEMVEFNWVLFNDFIDKVQIVTTKLNNFEIDKSKWWRHK